jgi:hypothetical protein
MKYWITKHSLTLLGLGLTLLLVGWASGALAQTVEQVATEIDAVELTVSTVDEKATAAKGKADANSTKVVGVESRVTALELDVTVNSDRLYTLETSVPNQAQVDGIISDLSATQTAQSALAQDVAALQSAPPSSGKKYVVYDATGKRIDEWRDRSSVGKGLWSSPTGELVACNVTKESFEFVVRKPRNDFHYIYPTCEAHPDVMVVVWRDGNTGTVLSEPLEQTFDEAVEGLVFQNKLYRVDYSQEYFHQSARLYKVGINGGCVESIGATGQVWVAPLVYSTDLPSLVPPFTMVEE